MWSIACYPSYTPEGGVPRARRIFRRYLPAEILTYLIINFLWAGLSLWLVSTLVWGAFPHDFLFFDVLAGELEHESPVGLDAFYQPRRRVVHGVLPRHVGVRAAASVSKYHLIASL